MPGAPIKPGRVLFEFKQFGNQVRVAALDEATGTEVVVIAPASAAQGHMQQLALNKLRRKLETERGGSTPPR